jgi:hypothetical protein
MDHVEINITVVFVIYKKNGSLVVLSLRSIKLPRFESCRAIRRSLSWGPFAMLALLGWVDLALVAQEV